jgi:hypothetical protein
MDVHWVIPQFQSKAASPHGQGHKRDGQLRGSKRTAQSSAFWLAGKGSESMNDTVISGEEAG